MSFAAEVIDARWRAIAADAGVDKDDALRLDAREYEVLRRYWHERITAALRRCLRGRR